MIFEKKHQKKYSIKIEDFEGCDLEQKIILKSESFL